MPRSCVLLAVHLLTTVVCRTTLAATVAFTPVPYVDLSQPFLPGDHPTRFEVRLDSASASTIQSIDLYLVTPAIPGTIPVEFPNDAGNVSTPDSFVLASSFRANFVLNAVRHEGDPYPQAPFDIPGYADAVATGGFAPEPQTTAGGIVIGTLTLAPILEIGLYTFGVSSTVERYVSKLAGGSIPPGEFEPLFGVVYLAIIPEPTTVLLLGLAALTILRGRCPSSRRAASESASREAAEQIQPTA